MRRVLIPLCVLVALIAGVSAAVAATSTVQLAAGDAANVTCPSSLWKQATSATNWTVHCRKTTSPTPTTSSPAPSTSTVVPATTTAAPSTSSAPSGSWACTTSDFSGRCGTAWDPGSDPYCNDTQIQGVQGGTNAGCPYIDQNAWGPIPGETQTLNANSPGDWEIVNNTPTNPSGSVTTFPNVGAPFSEQPLSNFPYMVGSFSESMPHGNGVSAWAAYDNWFDNWGYEVMIQHDFTGNGPCDYVATATFGGSNGVPTQLWGLCTYGSELIWKLAAPGSTVGSNQTASESSGSVDIKAMIGWLVANGYMTANPTVTNISYGWEICSTAGQDETFRVNNYSLKDA